MSAIRAALFDIDGTLYHQLPVRACVALEMALHFAVRGAPLGFRRQATILLTFRAVREELRRIGRSTASLADLQFDETARRTASASAEVRRLVDEWMLRRPTKYLRHARRRNVCSLIRALAARGIQLGVLSDYPPAPKLEALGLAGAFPLRLCTTDPEINAFKPHPLGLQRACELWGLSPSEVVYVGDRAEVDGAGAVAAGMRCYLVNRGGAKRTPAARRNDREEEALYGSRGLEDLRRDCRAAA